MKNTTTVNEFEKTAVRVSLVSIIGNTILSLFKIIAGVIANSGAMVSDAVHSASDVFSSIIVIIGVKIAAKDSDKDHPYGHERFECVAAIVLAVILLICGLFIGHTAIEKIGSDNVGAIAVPGMLALIAAVVSIVSKEAMYWYTRFYALKLDSGALLADAWHHRSDALSSIGALIGIVGARMGYPLMDTAASLVICIFIIKAAYDIFKDAIEKMVDRSCSDEMENEIAECAANQDGVISVDSIQTRVFGNRIYVEIEICADGQIPLFKSHEMAKQVHDAIENKFEKIKHISVSVVPVEVIKEEKSKIAFICVHNSCRSQMAEAFAKLYLLDKFDCYSAGTQTKPEINSDAVRIMREYFDVDMQGQYSKLISDIPTPDIVVTMGCNVECHNIPCREHYDWGIDDPTGKSDEEFILTAQKIKEKILELK